MSKIRVALSKAKESRFAVSLFVFVSGLEKAVLVLPWILRTRAIRTFSDFQKLSGNPRRVYLAFLAHYKFWIPMRLKSHRQYFSVNARGFGEDAFHSMWLSLFAEFRFKNCLEIGVYRGQTMSLWSILQDYFEIKGKVTGCSPLDESGDEYSSYSELDYREDIRQNFRAVGATPGSIIPFPSQSEEAQELLKDMKFDLIYVDGSHDYEDVKADIRTAKALLHPRGILVLDDAALFTDYRPLLGSFAGHAGPSKAALAEETKSLERLGSCGHNIVFRLK